jgi:hypothetical protein
MSYAHEDQLVDIVTIGGDVVGQKPRKAIDKMHDIYHGVYVIVQTPDGMLLLSTIPRRNDLPNLYAGAATC